MISHQRKLREDRLAKDGCALRGHKLRDCSVSLITRQEAAEVIMQYEWLGSMPAVGLAYCGLFTPDRRLIGAAVFGAGSGTGSRDFCGTENAGRVVCLERGACAPIASTSGHADNGASYLIARATKLVNAIFGWAAFFAYSDVEAGEIGTVYQACGWDYLGQGSRRNSGKMIYRDTDGKEFSCRAMRSRMKNAGFDGTLKEFFPEVLQPDGWTRSQQVSKHKYVMILDESMELDGYGAQPYPKRHGNSIGAAVADWRHIPGPVYRRWGQTAAERRREARKLQTQHPAISAGDSTREANMTTGTDTTEARLGELEKKLANHEAKLAAHDARLSVHGAALAEDDCEDEDDDDEIIEWKIVDGSLTEAVEKMVEAARAADVAEDDPAWEDGMAVDEVTRLGRLEAMAKQFREADLDGVIGVTIHFDGHHDQCLEGEPAPAMAAAAIEVFVAGAEANAAALRAKLLKKLREARAKG